MFIVNTSASLAEDCPAEVVAVLWSSPVPLLSFLSVTSLKFLELDMTAVAQLAPKSSRLPMELSEVSALYVELAFVCISAGSPLGRQDEGGGGGGIVGLNTIKLCLALPARTLLVGVIGLNSGVSYRPLSSPVLRSIDEDVKLNRAVLLIKKSLRKIRIDVWLSSSLLTPTSSIRRAVELNPSNGFVNEFSFEL